jgi:hypothetical protein
MVVVLTFYIYIGYKTKVVKNVTLQLGETYNLKETLDEDAKQLGEVVVVAKGSKFSVEKTGASTNISNAQIANMPTVSRSITDITRLSPYGGNGMSFAGADGRTANFTVDGANFNNNFGLSSKLPGGGAPISLDAIEEMQVVISPYDVRQTNIIRRDNNLHFLDSFLVVVLLSLWMLSRKCRLLSLLMMFVRLTS